MFGTFRVILAILVLLSHIFVNAQFNYGVSAVIGFLMISGYVMAVMIRQNYGKIGKSTLYFYADRFLRIYPQYFLFIVLTQIADLNWHFNAYFLHTTPTPWKFFLNALIVPANYYMLLNHSISQYLLIPAAWSLGLEEQFYWIFPFLILIPWLGRATTIVSFTTYLIAAFGILNSELFAFRFLPGVIFIFLLGKNLAEYNLTKKRENLWTMISLYSATVILTLYMWFFSLNHLLEDYNNEVLAGIIIGFPMIVFLSRLQRQKWDEFLGHCSYGIFLCHILIKYIFTRFRLYDIALIRGPWTSVIAFVLVCIIVGF